MAAPVKIWGPTDVSSSGNLVTGPVLEQQMTYQIISDGVFYPMGWSGTYVADAQYYDDDRAWGDDYLRPADGHSFLQVSGEDVDWGEFSPSLHRYYLNVLGTGTPVTFQIIDWVDQSYENNNCHLSVRIYQCAGTFTIGYWKNHAWPVSSITVGGVTYTRAEALPLLKASAKEMNDMLMAQLIGAKLNGLNGACAPSEIQDAISDADAFLQSHPDGAGEDRSEAEELKDILDNYNNGII